MNYPEQELVRKSRNGDISAFEELIRTHEKRIFNIALKMMGNREDASDIAQEVCIKIFKSLDKFKENSSFSTWVYRITSNICIDELRKRKDNTKPLIAASEDGEFEIQIEDKGKKPDEILESKEISRLVKKCIDELPADYKMIIILRDMHGYSYEEISGIIDINIGTVKSRLSRARNLLRDKIKSREHFEDWVV